MKKRNILIMLAVLLIAGTAFASPWITPDVEMELEFEEVPNELGDGVEILDEFFDIGNEFNEDIADISEWEINDETVSILSTLSEVVDVTVENKSRFQIIREIASFEEEYNMDQNTREQFEQWLSEGKDYRLLMYIYEFWITTNEDISIISDAYDMFVRNYDEDMRLPANKSLWFEGIFNTLTGNKFGKITSDDIDIYMDAGLSLSDIKLAERISRAGVKNVHEILDDRTNNITWSSIAAEIYDMPELLSYPELDIITLQDILTLSKITGEKADVILARAENSSMEEVMYQHLIESQRKADNTLIIAGLWEFNTPEEKKMVMNAISDGFEPVKALSNAKRAIVIDEIEVVDDRHDTVSVEEIEEIPELEANQDDNKVIEL